MSSKSIFYIATLSTLFFTSPAWSSRICYFSLNNQKEFEEMDKFTKKLNTVSKTPIEIQEFQTEGSDVKQSFEAMAKSGVKCDGLVISGHHTGSFGGKRGNGQLDISFMEELSCKEEYKGFFENVKALWLQGCRTLGVGKIEANDTADMHTDRVGAVLAEDNLTQSFAQLNMEFSSTLDQDNPLSSRYLRVFPRANTFGWTKTAPGEKAKSEFSIPYHIAHIAHLNDDRGRYFDNPVGEQIDSKDLATYVLAFNQLFKAPDCSQCEESKVGNKKTAKDIVLEAWMDQGDGSKKYALANSDLNAYPSIYKSNDELLKKAKEIECFMKNSDDHKKIAEVITEAIKSEAMIGRSFHSIYEYMQRLKNEGKFAELDELNKKLKESPALQNFLMRKFASKELGVLRKIDYYTFWKDMTGQQVEGIEKQLNEYLFEIVTKENPNNDQNQIDFIQTVLQSLSKNNLLKSDTLMRIVDSDKVNSDTLDSVVRAIRDANSPIVGVADVLTKIISSDKANAKTLDSVADAIGFAESPIAGVTEVLTTILSSDKANANTLSSVAKAIGVTKSPITGRAEILTKIMSSKNADESTLRSVAKAISDAKSPIAGGAEILTKIISSEKANADTLRSVANAIGDAKAPITGGAEVLAKIISSEKANADTLRSVAYAIKDTKSPIAGGTEILSKVMSSEKANADTLGSVFFTIGYAKSPIDGVERILAKIMNSEKASADTLGSVARAIGNSKSPIIGGTEMLTKIMNSEKANADTLGSVARAIGNSKSPIIGGTEMLTKIMNSEKADAYTLGSVAIAIGNSNAPIIGGTEMLSKIMNSEKANGNTLGNIARAIGDSKSPIIGGNEMLTKIMDSVKANRETVDSVAYTIKTSNSPEEMLIKILNSEKTNQSILMTATKSVIQSKSSLIEKTKMIKKIIKSAKANDNGLVLIANEIRIASPRLSNEQELLSEIEKRELELESMDKHTPGIPQMLPQQQGYPYNSQPYPRF